MSKQVDALKLALEVLENNKQKHHYCEDTWYSCPKHEEGCANYSEGDECNCGADEINAQFDKAITAIKEALAQPKQEPDLSMREPSAIRDRLIWAGWTPPAQPEQEPMALPPVQFEKVAEGIEIGYDMLGGVDIRLGGEFIYVHINYDYRYTHNSARKALAEQIVGLLTTPLQRKPLTRDELWKLWCNSKAEDEYMFWLKFARAIEAAHGIRSSDFKE